jgi:ABC-2 type transport system permease protein
MSVAGIPLTAGGPAMAVRMLGSETAKGLLLMWRRRGLLIASIAENGLTYLAIRFLIGGGHISRSLVAVTLPALLAATVASTAALQGSAGIAEEVYSGTLEQAQLGPARQAVQVFGRLGALAVEGLIGAIALGLAFGFGFGVSVDYWLRPDVLVPGLLTLLDALGYALLITALTLAVASIGAITHVFNMAVSLFNGTLVPITVFPGAIRVAVELVPTTLGVQVMNGTLAGGSLGAAWANGTLPWLLIHAVALLGLGWLTYSYTIRSARRKGGLSPR